MRNFSTDVVNNPAYYTHYKGTEYLVMHVATHTETGEKLVVYSDMVGDLPKTWTRPATMFLEDVKLEDGTSVPRFKFTRWGSRT
jgi:hypothetical protein